MVGSETITDDLLSCFDFHDVEADERLPFLAEAFVVAALGPYFPPDELRDVESLSERAARDSYRRALAALSRHDAALGEAVRRLGAWLLAREDEHLPRL